MPTTSSHVVMEVVLIRDKDVMGDLTVLTASTKVNVVCFDFLYLCRGAHKLVSVCALVSFTPKMLDTKQ